jgi:hypothetical protein
MSQRFSSLPSIFSPRVAVLCDPASLLVTLVKEAQHVTIPN